MVTARDADPVGVTEIAERLGVAPDTIQKWRARHEGFPAARWPQVGGRPAWHWPDIQAWLRGTGRPSEPVWVELMEGESPYAAGVDYGDVAPLPSVEGDAALWAWLDGEGYGPDQPNLWINLVPIGTWAPNNTPAAQRICAVTVEELRRIEAAMEEEQS
ncbi:MAG TPA: helix-turn-helix domain-containing protein [Kutzneria sp.]|jgi:hypothetical protein|nr:helix-turn-helix domain-containing protein [Kutzneria sp.]